MLVNEYKALHNLTDRQWRTLKATFEKTYPCMDITTRTGSKSFDIIENVKPLLDKLLTPKTNVSDNATNISDNTKDVEVLTGELIEYDYTEASNSNALAYGNSNVKQNHSGIVTLTKTLQVTDELFSNITNAIDIHRRNMKAQEDATAKLNDELDLKLTVVKEKLQQVRKEEIIKASRVSTAMGDAQKKLEELSALSSSLASHLS